MAKTPAAERARRLIAVLGNLRNNEQRPLEELARSVGATPAEFAEDVSTLSMCGLAPYDPSGLVPVMVDGDTVLTFGEMPALRGPVRLSATEANALAAALQAAGIAVDDPLVTDLLSSSATSFDPVELESLVRAGAASDASVFEQLSQGLQHRLVVEIEYAKPEEPMSSARAVEPLALFAERGVWYVVSWCRSARAVRTFRLDRIRAARATDEGFQPREDAALAKTTAFDPAGLPLARLRFRDAAEYIEREWPGARPASADAAGGAIVEVPFAGQTWITRKVVARLGAVEVLDPPELRASVASLAAEVAASL